MDLLTIRLSLPCWDPADGPIFLWYSSALWEMWMIVNVNIDKIERVFDTYNNFEEKAVLVAAEQIHDLRSPSKPHRPSLGPSKINCPAGVSLEAKGAAVGGCSISPIWKVGHTFKITKSWYVWRASFLLERNQLQMDKTPRCHGLSEFSISPIEFGGAWMVVLNGGYLSSICVGYIMIIPVVPHKAVAEVSKMKNL